MYWYVDCAGVYTPEPLNDFSWDLLACGILFLYHFIFLQPIGMVRTCISQVCSHCTLVNAAVKHAVGSIWHFISLYVYAYRVEIRFIEYILYAMRIFVTLSKTPISCDHMYAQFHNHDVLVPYSKFCTLMRPYITPTKFDLPTMTCIIRFSYNYSQSLSSNCSSGN